MSIAPSVSLCANLLLFCLMLGFRTKRAYIWLVQGAAMLGCAFLFWNDVQFGAGQLTEFAYNERLARSHLLQFWAEMVGLGWLTVSTRAMSLCTRRQAVLWTAIVVHLFLRLQEWNQWTVGTFEDKQMRFFADCANLIMIAAMSADVVSTKENQNGNEQESEGADSGGLLKRGGHANLPNHQTEG